MKKQELIELLEPTVNALGYELIDLDVKLGRGGLLRLFIDKDPAVTLDDSHTAGKHAIRHDVAVPGVHHVLGEIAIAFILICMLFLIFLIQLH